MWSKFWTYVLVACAVVGLGFDSLPNPRREVEDAGIFLPVEVDVNVFWTRCDSVNGYYSDGIIELCKENLQLGVPLARAIFLHELGHAYVESHHIDYSRFNGNYEAQADDFAAIMALIQGHPEDLLAIADFFEDWALKYVQRADDPHPPMMERVKHFRDIYLGYMAPWTPEFQVYRASLVYWRVQMLEHP